MICIRSGGGPEKIKRHRDKKKEGHRIKTDNKNDECGSPKERKMAPSN